jgi:hypothetical protein
MHSTSQSLPRTRFALLSVMMTVALIFLYHNDTRYFAERDSNPLSLLCRSLALLKSQEIHGNHWKYIAEDVNKVSLTIAQAIGTEPNVRNGNQCRERFVNHLDPW